MLTEKFERSEIYSLVIIENLGLEYSQNHVTSEIISFVENFGFLKIFTLSFGFLLIRSLVTFD